MCNCALLVSKPDEFIFGVVLSWTRSVGSLEAEFLASLIFSFFSTAVGLRVDLSRTFSVMWGAIRLTLSCCPQFMFHLKMQLKCIYFASVVNSTYAGSVLKRSNISALFQFFKKWAKCSVSELMLLGRLECLFFRVELGRGRATVVSRHGVCYSESVAIFRGEARW